MAFDVFLSHFSEEQSLAKSVQNCLSLVFDGRVQVFRSSDHESIPTGKDPHHKIIEALREVKFFIALVSKDGAERPWLNFEAGFAEALKIPSLYLLVRNTSASDVPLPIGRLQLRSLATKSVIKEVVEAISSATGANADSYDPEYFVEEFKKREAEMPNRELRLVPFRTVSGEGKARSERLQFEIIYNGTRPIELVKVWAELPLGLKGTNWSRFDVPGHLRYEEKRSGNEGVCFLELTANPNSHEVRFGGTSFRLLHPHLPPSATPQLLKELAFALRQDLSPEALAKPIRWQITTEDSETPIAECRLDDLEVRQST